MVGLDLLDELVEIDVIELLLHFLRLVGHALDHGEQRGLHRLGQGFAGDIDLGGTGAADSGARYGASSDGRMTARGQ